MTTDSFWRCIRNRLARSMLAILCLTGTCGFSSVPNESSGTAIFFEWLDDRFIVATDSLETHANPPPTFDACKIVVQGAANNFFTISGGLRWASISTVVEGKPKKLDWDTQKTAAKAYNTVSGTKDPKKVAEEWKRLILEQLKSLPIHTRRELSPVKNNQMLFVGLLPDGSIDAQVATFSFDVKTFDITIVRPPKNKIRSMAEGENAVAEFMLHKTPEARQEDENTKSMKIRTGRNSIIGVS